MGSITSGASSIAEAIRNKIKNNEEQRKSSLILDSLEARISENAIKSGGGEEALEGYSKSFDALRKAKLTASETLAVAKAISPNMFKDMSSQNIYVQGNDGAPRLTGTVPGGSKVFKENLTPEAIGDRAKAVQDVRNAAPTAEMKQSAFNLESQIKNFDAAMELLNGSPQGRISGSVASATGAITGGKENTAGKLYADILPGLSASLYKDMTGDTRLSDADAQSRAYPLFPKQGDDPKLNKLKEEFIKSTLKRRQSQYKSGDFSPMSQGEVMDQFVKFVASGGKEDKSNKSSDTLSKLGLDPNKFELVEE